MALLGASVITEQPGHECVTVAMVVRRNPCDGQVVALEQVAALVIT